MIFISNQSSVSLESITGVICKIIVHYYSWTDFIYPNLNWLYQGREVPNLVPRTPKYLPPLRLESSHTEHMLLEFTVLQGNRELSHGELSLRPFPKDCIRVSERWIFWFQWPNIKYSFESDLNWRNSGINPPDLTVPPGSVIRSRIMTRAHFLSLVRSKLKRCSASHRPGYWSNLPCDWPSTAWVSPSKRQKTGPGERTLLLEEGYYVLKDKGRRKQMQSYEHLPIWDLTLLLYPKQLRRIFTDAIP